MIAKLRRQFILINMSFVALILVTVFAAFCTISYHNACADTMSSLHHMLDNGYKNVPPAPENGEQLAGGKRIRPNDIKKNVPPERTPMFYVSVDSSGNTELVKTENITVDDELINSAAEYVREREKDEGVISELNLRYVRRVTPRGEQIVFADRTNETSTLKNLLITSLVAGVGGLLAFFCGKLVFVGDSGSAC